MVVIKGNRVHLRFCLGGKTAMQRRWRGERWMKGKRDELIMLGGGWVEDMEVL